MNGDSVKIDAFLQHAAQYKQQLTAVATYEELVALWNATSIPYRYRSMDPFSEAYADEVLALYAGLVGTSYSTLNELTSSKQSSETFAVGFPWHTRNLDACARETSRIVQALRAFHAADLAGKKIVEFGAGWGNLAIPLAKSGLDVTVVDIDEGFLARIGDIASRENVQVAAHQGDFIAAAGALAERYDAAVFQSSFHHCLEFERLLTLLRDNVLSEDGSVYFFSEPIAVDYPFPWGLRFDGESLWAIMCNHWLELGFREDFFSVLLLRKGFLASTVEALPPYVGEGWRAVKGAAGIAADQWRLAEVYRDSFAPAREPAGFGRYCLESSQLPGLRGADRGTYRLQFQNYAARDLRFTLRAGSIGMDCVLRAGEARSFDVKADCERVVIQSETYVAHAEWNNGDMRRLGVVLKSVRIMP